VDRDRGSDRDDDVNRDSISTANRDRHDDVNRDDTANRDRDCIRTANRDHTSTATRSGATGIFDRIRDSTTPHRDRDSTTPHRDRDSTTPHRDRRQHRTSSSPTSADAPRTARVCLPRARRSRARRKQGGGARNSPLITALESFYTPHEPPARHPLRPVLEPDAGRELVATGTESCLSDSEDRFAVRSSAVGEEWGVRVNRVPNRQTTRWVPTSDDVCLRKLGWD
jgi:hypothetical protein